MNIGQRSTWVTSDLCVAEGRMKLSEQVTQGTAVAFTNRFKAEIMRSSEQQKLRSVETNSSGSGREVARPVLRHM